jgi:rubrerythrin
MSATPDARGVASLAELLAIAYRIESDAVERYTLLAEQMQSHNNLELAKVFSDLARAEGIHAEEIRRQAEGVDVVELARHVSLWKQGESPEEADLGAAHYLMTPWHALRMALAGEEQALAYFQSVVESTSDPKIKEMAAEFVEEEAEHVNLVHRLLRRHRAPAETWSEDPDPATGQA